MVGWRWLDKMEIRLTQPQVELEGWAELGKKITRSFYNCKYLYWFELTNNLQAPLPHVLCRHTGVEDPLHAMQDSSLRHRLTYSVIRQI